MEGLIRYEGLNDLIRAFKEVDAGILPELKNDLGKVGDVVRDEARRRFETVSTKTAAGFETRVRVGSSALVVVAQSLRKTTGTRPDFGARQMRDALLPARAAKHEQAVEILEAGAGRLLKQHGF